MKNKFLSIITLLVSTSLMMACNTGKQIPVPAPSSNPSSSDSGENYEDEGPNGSVASSDSNGSVESSNNESSNNESSDVGSSENQPVVDKNSLDGVIAQFIEDYDDVIVPALNGYNLDFDILYYYAYDEYFIFAQGADVGGLIEAEYLAKFDEIDTGLICQNDDDFYTVEEYGYMYGTADDSLGIYFYTEADSFYFTIIRDDGTAGSLDVSNIDTNWYVDYLTFQAFDLTNAFPAEEIKEYFELSSTLVIPSISAQEFAVGLEEAHLDDNGFIVPDNYQVVLKGDRLSDYVTILKAAGYTAEITETEDYDFDWDALEIIEVTIQTAYAFDASKEVYITIELDEYENTVVKFSRFDDSFVADKTTNTDWTDEEKALMIASFGECIPFMQFGSDYEIFDNSNEEYTSLALLDCYYEDLSDEYFALLLENGYKEDSASYLDTCYYYDNGEYYIEIFAEFNGGNFLAIYFEESHLEPLTNFALDFESLDIVAGASYQLNALFEPANGARPITWSTNNGDVATVENGLVTINSAAEVGQTAVITASVAGGLTASCTFNVAENVVTGIAYTQDNYNIIPGGAKITPEYVFYPIGVNPTGFNVSYTTDPVAVGNDLGIYYDGYGKLNADQNAVPGTTITIKVYANQGLTHFEASATVTVVPATITHTLDRDFFGIQKENYSKYMTYSKTTTDGATYEAFAAGNNGIQLKSKDSVSGLIGHLDGRTCKSITITFDQNTYNPKDDNKGIEIYASNEPFEITDMYNGKVDKIGSVAFDQNNLTKTYTFTEQYSYIGIRSINGATYLTSIEIVWQ